MRIVLPPSETKQAGGNPTPLDFGQLALPELVEVRELLLRGLEKLCLDEERAKKALQLGPKLTSLVGENLRLRSAPTLPALTRYTGVVYDALDYPRLGAAQRARADRMLWVFSALFGPLRATDEIPAYRFSAGTKLPGVNLAKVWGAHRERIFAGDFTIDLRSEAYRALCPLSLGSGVFVRVVTNQPGGRVAVGHANKATKGALVRQMVASGADITSVEELVAWGRDHGYRFEPDQDLVDEVWLVIDV